MAWLEKLNHPENYIKHFLKWGLLGILMGVLGGLVGAGFHHALHFVTHVRCEHTWLIFLLPVGGVLTGEPMRSSMLPWKAVLSVLWWLPVSSWLHP